MKRLTMLEFRRNAWRTLEAVQRGERFLLTYRGRPIARLEPVRPGRSEVADDDALLRIEDFAVEGAGGAVRNEEIDRLLYGGGRPE